MLRILFSTRAKATLSALRRGGWAQFAVIAAFVAIGSTIFVGAFLLFLRAFKAIGADAEVGPFVTEYVLGTSFALTFFLGFASFIASAPWFFHRAEELNLLFSLPIAAEKIYAYRFGAAALAAGWPVMIIAVPAVLAYGAVGGIALSGLLVLVLAVALFTAAIMIAGGFAAFLLAPMTRRLPSPALWIAEAAAFLLGIWWLAKRIAPRTLIASFAEAAGSGTSGIRAQLDSMFAWLPSAPFVRIITGVSTDFSGSIGRVVMITAMTAVAAAALIELAARNYGRDWQLHGDRPSRAKPSGAEAGPRRRLPFPRIFRLGHGYLLEKDLLLLVRDGGEMARAASLGALLIFFIVSLRAVAGVDAFGSPDFFALAVTFVFGAVGYLALTFCMRFVFPAFSAEGRGAWAVMSGPIHAHELYSWKLFFWASCVAVLAVPAVTAVAAMFGLSDQLAAFMIFSMCCSSAAVTAMTLGQGTIYPRFKERNPDMIATSPAGLAATVIGMAYLAVVTRYVHSATVATLAGEGIPARFTFGVLTVSLALTSAYWMMALRRLDKMEITA